MMDVQYMSETKPNAKKTIFTIPLFQRRYSGGTARNCIGVLGVWLHLPCFLRSRRVCLHSLEYGPPQKEAPNQAFVDDRLILAGLFSFLPAGKQCKSMDHDSMCLPFHLANGDG